MCRTSNLSRVFLELRSISLFILVFPDRCAQSLSAMPWDQQHIRSDFQSVFIRANRMKHLIILLIAALLVTVKSDCELSSDKKRLFCSDVSFNNLRAYNDRVSKTAIWGNGINGYFLGWHCNLSRFWKEYWQRNTTVCIHSISSIATFNNFWKHPKVKSW